MMGEQIAKRHVILLVDDDRAIRIAKIHLNHCFAAAATRRQGKYGLELTYFGEWERTRLLP